MSLLLKVKPLVVSPVLACRIGLNEAIVLQQICYWLEETNSGVEHGGKRWVYNSINAWNEQFPWWTGKTIQRTVSSLKRSGLIYVEQLKKKQHDQTNYYAINYASPLLTDKDNLSLSKRTICPNREGKSVRMDKDSLSQSIGSTCPTLTENTTENTTEITGKDSRPVSAKPDTLSDIHPNAAVSSPLKRQWGSEEDLTCAKWIWSRISSMYEKAAEADGEVSKPKEPNWADWSNEVRLMCSRDGRTHRQICELFSRVQRDPFWCRNVLSPSKLREKWDELSIKLSAAGGQRNVNDTANTDYDIPDGWKGA